LLSLIISHLPLEESALLHYAYHKEYQHPANMPGHFEEVRKVRRLRKSNLPWHSSLTYQTTGLKKDDQGAYTQAVYKGGLQGTALAAGINIPLHFILRRRPQYNAIPVTLKALGYVVLTIPCISIAAEKAGEAFIRSTWTGTGKNELDRDAQRAAMRWDSLGTWQKAQDWGSRHKWGLIGAA
jgi:hypothetical protein